MLSSKMIKNGITPCVIVGLCQLGSNAIPTSGTIFLFHDGPINVTSKKLKKNPEKDAFGT